MRSPLQEQLLKAGLAKKSQVADVVREQNRQRHAKTTLPAEEEKVDAHQLQRDRAERDRAMAAERNALARVQEARAQVRQIIEAAKLKRDGEIAYSFEDSGMIKRVLVDKAERALLATGALVIARHGDGYELVPRVAADKIIARDATVIVLDHAHSATAQPIEEDAYYRQFKVPHDLTW